jgi:hypothetical protein
MKFEIYEWGKRARQELGYFRCLIGNIVEAWSYCTSRSDSDMLRVWFDFTVFRGSLA